MKGASMNQAEDVKQYIQDQLVDQDWVKEVFLEQDDLGWNVMVKVDGVAYRDSGHRVPGMLNDVSVMTMMIG